MTTCMNETGKPFLFLRDTAVDGKVWVTVQVKNQDLQIEPGGNE